SLATTFHQSTHLLRGFAPISLFACIFLTRCQPALETSSRSRSTKRDFHCKKHHDQSVINPPYWCRGGNYRRLRKQSCRRYNCRISRRAARLRTIVGNLAIDSWSGQRKVCTCKCGAKDDSGYRSQHIPISTGKRRWHTSGGTLHRQPEHETQTSRFNCRRRTKCGSADARHLRGSRCEPSARVLGPARWPTSDRVQVIAGKRTHPPILEENRTCAATLSFERSRNFNKTSVRMKAMRGRIALQKHFVRNVSADISTISRQLWECARVLASLLFSSMRNIEDVTVK